MADAEFSFNSVPLLFDCDRVAQRFLERYLPIEQMVAPPGNPASDDWQGNTYGQGRAGLPRPNYPPPPPPRINTLYWPTGAARWARGWFLCDQDGVDKLTDQGNADSPWASGSSTAKTLRVSTPSTDDSKTPYVLEAELHMLRPLRITATGDTTFGDLWIVPLVDQRYWWQFRGTGDLSESLDTWDDLITALGTALGTTIKYSVIWDAYMIPDKIELARHHDNAAVVLDAVAASIGRRVVAWFGETIWLDDYLGAIVTLERNFDYVRTGDMVYLGLQGGTDHQSDPPAATPWPASVSLAFQKIEDPSDIGAAQFWISSTTATVAAAAVSNSVTVATGNTPPGASDIVTTAGTAKTIHCSAWAMFQAVDPPTADPTDPANKTNLDALALQYAEDYYGWLLYQYDYSWPGVQRWWPTGYCDHVLFELGTEYVEELEALADLNDQHEHSTDVLVREQLARRYLTRAQSLPGNFGVSSLLCQYEHAIPGVADGLVVMTPATGIAARVGTALSKAACAVYTEVQGSMTLTAVSCDDSDTPWKIQVYNLTNAAVGADRYVVTDILKSGVRYVVVESCNAEA